MIWIPTIFALLVLCYMQFFLLGVTLHTKFALYKRGFHGVVSLARAFISWNWCVSQRVSCVLLRVSCVSQWVTCGMLSIDFIIGVICKWLSCQFVGSSDINAFLQS